MKALHFVALYLFLCSAAFAQTTYNENGIHAINGNIAANNAGGYLPLILIQYDDVKPLYKTEYQYNDSFKIINQTKRFWIEDNSEWILNAAYNYTYDEAGNLIEVNYHHDAGGYWRYINKEYIYDGADNVQYITFKELDTIADEYYYYSRYVFEYNSIGIISNVYYQIWNNNEWQSSIFAPGVPYPVLAIDDLFTNYLYTPLIHGFEVVSFLQINMKPDLLYPAANSEDVPIDAELAWIDTDNAESYQIHISRSADFADTLINAEGIESLFYFPANLEYETTYFWRVMAHNESGRGPWSNIWQFKTGESVSINECAANNNTYFTAINISNGNCAVKYYLEDAVYVNIDVYDSMGNKVAELVNDFQNAGMHEARFNADGLAQGVYYFSAKANDASAIGKFLFVK